MHSYTPKKKSRGSRSINGHNYLMIESPGKNMDMRLGCMTLKHNTIINHMGFHIDTLVNSTLPPVRS